MPFADPDDLAAALGQPHRPTEQQRAVITAPLSPLLVVAGAGSGKTATMADRVVWLVANGLARPEEILGVTFTRKAAGELAERLRGHLNRLRQVLGSDVSGDLAMEPAVSTYHSFAKTLVAEHGMRIGLEPDAPQRGPAQCWQLASRVVDAYDGPHEHLTAARSTLIDAVLGYAGQAAEHLVDPGETAEWLEERADLIAELPFGATARTTSPTSLISKLRTHATVARLAEQYQQAKRTRGVLDFGDLVAYAARLATLTPVQQALRSRYKVVLLDEFQDTSHAQIQLFSRLFGDGAHAVTAVGDPNQAIYGFRGASAGQLAAFRTHFPVTDTDGEDRPAPVAQLTTAWRNDENILRAANVIAAPLNRSGHAGATSAATPSTAEGARGGEPAASGTGALPDAVGLADAAPSPECADGAAGAEVPPRIRLPRPMDLRVDPLTPRPGATPGRVVLQHAVTAEQEAEQIAELLEREREAWRGCEGAWPSVAVLSRTKSAMGPIADALIARGIPVEVVGLNGLLSTPEVQDVVATLQVIADPGRSDALMRLLAGARWRISPADLMALADWSQLRAKRRSWAVAHLQEADFETPDGESPADAGHAGETEIVDQASLVEALDNLPAPGWRSREGRVLGERAHARLARLRDELRGLRRLVGEELDLLVAEVVRTLGLDVEVLAKPGRDEHAARRHLDAFAGVAAHFDGGDGEADLPTFLEWLEAAREKESGLSTAPEPATDGTVQLLTVHASKGLEWDIVVVPALMRSVFPSDKASRWTLELGELPWPLRGDAAELPQFSALDMPEAWFEHQKALEDFEKDTKETGYAAEVKRHAEREERRLAYVAYTRARSLLVCSASDYKGYAKAMVEPSPFFAELEALLPDADETLVPASSVQVELPQVQRGVWEALPAEVRELDPRSRPDNPASGVQITGEWPFDPLAGPTLLHGDEPRPPARPSRRPALEAAALDVSLAARGIAESGQVPEFSTEAGRAWELEARQLLAERAERDAPPQLSVPGHVRASLFVEAADDREAVLADLMRPVPHRPGIAARQGTLFHTWVQEHYGRSGQFDLDETQFFADVQTVDGPALAGLKELFLASEWAHKVPVQVEAPVETRIGPVPVRGRIDAVFRDEDGRWDLVDWKTGHVPSAAELPRKALQLAVYRLGFARLHGIALADIDAAFYYVAHGRTVRPPALAEEAELEAMITALLQERPEPGRSREEARR